MAGHVADEHRGFVVGKGGDAEKIAADRLGRLVAVDELKGALLRRNIFWKDGVLLRQHGSLDFTRHPQIFLHDQIFGAHFLAAARQFAGGAADLVLGALAFGDVLNGAFVVKQFPFRVAHGAAIFRNPDDRLVLAVNFRLETAQRVVLLHQADELVAPARFDVKIARDILDARHQFRRRFVTVDARQRHVRQQVMAVGRRAEDAFHKMVEYAVVIVLFLDQSDALLLPFHGAANGAPQPARLNLILRQIILRARANRFGCEPFIVRRAENDYRNARRLNHQQGDLRQTVVVRGGKFQERGVKGILPKLRQTGVDRRRGGRLIGFAAFAQQAGHVARKTLVLPYQQNFQRFRFHTRSARPSGAGSKPFPE